MKVLVVGDSRVMRQMVVRALRQAGLMGCDAVEAADGADGLAAVAEHSPDLVLSDWNMPGMGGLAFLQALRAGGDWTPFGFVTSERAVHVREQALAAGAGFVVHKPFTAEGLHEAVMTMSGPEPVRRRGPVCAVSRAGLETVLPERKAVRDMLEVLLGRDVPVGDGERVHAHAHAPDVTTAEIVDDFGAVSALIVADLPLAVFAGAALGLTPPDVAREMLAGRACSEPVREAFAEVLNVLSAVFNGPGAPHVRLGRVWLGPAQVPVAVADLAREAGGREDLAVEVTGYGAGNLSLILS